MNRGWLCWRSKAPTSATWLPWPGRPKPPRSAAPTASAPSRPAGEQSWKLTSWGQGATATSLLAQPEGDGTTWVLPGGRGGTMCRVSEIPGGRGRLTPGTGQALIFLLPPSGLQRGSVLTLWPTLVPRCPCYTGPQPAPHMGSGSIMCLNVIAGETEAQWKDLLAKDHPGVLLAHHSPCTRSCCPSIIDQHALPSYSKSC